MYFSLLSLSQNKLIVLVSLTVLCKRIPSQCYLQHLQISVKMESSKCSNISKLLMFSPIEIFSLQTH